MNKNHKNSGFTLIETVIYTALIVIFIGGSVLIVNNIITNSSKLNNIIAIEEEANFILKKLEWAFSDADRINSPASGSSSSTISVNKEEFGNNPIIFALSENDITIKIGSETTKILNSESISINSLNFEHIAGSEERPEGIEIDMTIENKEYNSIFYLRQ